jgi:hypothetical protein
VPGLPYTAMPDTCVATTDAVDADLNANCDGAPTDASVWYELTAAADGGIVVDGSNSSYSAGDRCHR